MILILLSLVWHFSAIGCIGRGKCDSPGDPHLLALDSMLEKRELLELINKTFGEALVQQLGPGAGFPQGGVLFF